MADDGVCCDQAAVLRLAAHIEDDEGRTIAVRTPHHIAPAQTFCFGRLHVVIVEVLVAQRQAQMRWPASVSTACSTSRASRRSVKHCANRRTRARPRLTCPDGSTPVFEVTRNHTTVQAASNSNGFAVHSVGFGAHLGS